MQLTAECVGPGALDLLLCASFEVIMWHFGSIAGWERPHLQCHTSNGAFARGAMQGGAAAGAAGRPVQLQMVSLQKGNA